MLYSDLRGLIIPESELPLKHREDIPYRQFGKGSIHEFSWYFEGKSQVSVSSVREICNWLQGCKYVEDKDLFQEDDFWSHPVTFEALRKGDCADHALWAWRKLTELKIPAEFICGRVRENGAFLPHGHAWVVYRDVADESLKLIETTDKGPGIIKPLNQTTAKYYPERSVDGKLLTYRYSRG